MAVDQDHIVGDLVTLRKLQAQVGWSDTTSWRMRQSYGLKTINIAGKLYVRGRDWEEFLSRADSGELAKPPSGVARRKAAAGTRQKERAA